MKYSRIVLLLVALFTMLLLAACGSESSEIAEIEPTTAVNEQAVAVNEATAEEILPAPVVIEATPVPTELPNAEPVAIEAPVVEETAPGSLETGVCPFPKALTDHYGEGIKDSFLPYSSDVDGFCVYYPENFTIGDEIVGTNLEGGKTGNVVGIYGPRLDESLDPVAASLNIVITEADAADLTSFADQYAAQGTYSSRQQIDVNGVSAESFYGVPGRSLISKVFMVHNGRLYELTFYPDDPAFPQAQPDLLALKNAVLQTWTFLE